MQIAVIYSLILKRLYQAFRCLNKLYEPKAGGSRVGGDQTLIYKAQGLQNIPQDPILTISPVGAARSAPSWRCLSTSSRPAPILALVGQPCHWGRRWTGEAASTPRWRLSSCQPWPSGCPRHPHHSLPALPRWLRATVVSLPDLTQTRYKQTAHLSSITVCC